MTESLATQKPRDLRGTWPKALVSLGGAILFILTIRWALIEPYVIPSGSMIPTLLIHDHIFVNKFAYGFRLPFAVKYAVRFSEPKRGDVLVFRSVEDENTFLVKRVVGLPGDEIEITRDGLKVNGQLVPQRELTAEEKSRVLRDWTPDTRDEALQLNDIFEEKLDSKTHAIFRDRSEPQDNFPSLKVPADHYFMSGDNRDHSADSRMWGTLPFDRILGRASVIWLSCEEALAQTNQLCNPQTMRWHRLFGTIQ